MLTAIRWFWRGFRSTFPRDIGVGWCEEDGNEIPAFEVGRRFGFYLTRR
jgi:hypothetical protein